MAMRGLQREVGMQLEGTASAGEPDRIGTGDAAGRRRDRGFALVVAVVLLAAMPGILLKLDLAAGLANPLARWLSMLDRELRSISFGSGLRFWLGVGGAALMLLPLLYPLRKMAGLARFIGIGTWFDLHVVCGLMGPLLVLYHCNLGLGSTPANVALVTMLLVASSGLLGHFLYARLSARHYRFKAGARDGLAAIVAALRRLEPGPPRDRFIEDMLRFDDALAERRLGLLATAGGMRSVERDFEQRAAWLAATQAQRSGGSVAQPAGGDGAVHLRSLVQDYFAALRKAERWRVADRLWAHWRLMHLPVFAIMVVAAGIHVARVWDIDERAGNAGIEVATALPRSASGDAAIDRSASTAAAAAARNAASPVTVRSIRTVAVAPAEPAAEGSQMPAVPMPRLAQRRAGAATTATDASLTAIAELEQRNRESRSGTFDPTLLAGRLRQFKLDRFDHARTGFPLTGKHSTLDCASCHKTTLKDTARECVACHRKDDVHRGRRPDCAQCHVTSDWSRIVKRR